MRTTYTLCAALSLAAGLAGAAQPLARADAEFLRQAAENHQAEIEGGKLALAKGVNTQVKGFAQQMVDDHTKASEELKALASAKGLETPAAPSMALKARLDLLASSDGSSFDRRYADNFGVNAHEGSIRLYQKAAAKAADADVKAFAAKALPTLQTHLQMAIDLRKATRQEGNVKSPKDRKQ